MDNVRHMKLIVVTKLNKLADLGTILPMEARVKFGSNGLKRSFKEPCTNVCEVISPNKEQSDIVRARY